MSQKEHAPLQALAQLIETVHRLRAPGGCPWDRAQTHQSLRPYLIEEAYEVLDVIDQIHGPEDLKREKIRLSFREELGDLLMQVVLHSEMADEAGAFNIYDVAQALDEKLIRRHPHVFGSTQATSADQALQSWEKQKAKEKAAPDASILDGVPKGLPSLQQAARVIEKVTKVGFQWSDMSGPLEKVDEELREFKEEVLALEKLQKTADFKDSKQAEEIRKKIEGELGDLLFTLANVGSLLQMNPENALRSTLAKFQRRFRHVERSLKELGRAPDQSDLNEMNQFWEEAKLLEKVEVWGLTGGIASGKSEAARCFQELGIPVLDADQIARELSQEGGEAHAQIVQRFGTAVPSELRQIIFKNPQDRKDLEAILHPLIQKKSREKLKALSAQSSVVLYEAALLVETGRYRDFNGLIVVHAPQDTRLNRLVARDQISNELGRQILDSQLSDQERNRHADWICENSGSLDSLRKEIRSFAEKRGWLKPA